MKSEDIYKSINDIDSDLIEAAAPKNRKRDHKAKTLYTVFAFAACLALIIGAVFAIPLQAGNENNIGSESSTGSENIVLSGVNGSSESNASSQNPNTVVLSAAEIARCFSQKDNEGTNRYQVIYTASPDMIASGTLPISATLPIVRLNGMAVNKDQFYTFVKQYIHVASKLGCFEVQQVDLESAFQACELKYEEYQLHFLNKPTNESVSCVARENYCGIFFKKSNGADNVFNAFQYAGEYQILNDTASDSEIEKQLEGYIAYLNTAFDTGYQNVKTKIVRYYDGDQLENIRVYIYDENSLLPVTGSDCTAAPLASDYIRLDFYTDWGEGRHYHHENGSPNKAELMVISYSQSVGSSLEYYDVSEEGRMLSLKEAEELLKKGYVFGGHSCPICMSMQKKVDFSDYEKVGFEYLRSEENDCMLPFYTFYKFIGFTIYGNQMYAKTYVPALEFSGMEEYLEAEESKHSQWIYEEHYPVPDDFKLYFASQTEERKEMTLSAENGYLKVEIGDQTLTTPLTTTDEKRVALYEAVMNLINSSKKLNMDREFTSENLKAPEDEPVTDPSLKQYQLRFTAKGTEYSFSGDTTAWAYYKTSPEAYFFAKAIEDILSVIQDISKL